MSTSFLDYYKKREKGDDYNDYKNLSKIARLCIKKYIAKYDLILEHSYRDDNYGMNGDMYLYIKQRHIKHSNKSFRQGKTFTDESIKIGHLHYSVDDEENNLQIDKINIKSTHKPELPVKLFKILLLYLLSFDMSIKSATLVAVNGDKTKIGEEFCLSCYYEELGFRPINLTIVEQIDDMFKTCSRKLKKKNNYDDRQTPICTLCRCQKMKISFTQEDLSPLQVDMKVLAPRLQYFLNKAYKEIDC